jgi:hypothetical protein
MENEKIRPDWVPAAYREGAEQREANPGQSNTSKPCRNKHKLKDSRSARKIAGTIVSNRKLGNKKR